MGGPGSGNEGRRKFGSKFYAFHGRYDTREGAEKDAHQLNNIEIKTKIVHEMHELPWYPHNEVMGYSVYYIPIYRRKTRAERNAPASGLSRRGRGW